MHLTQVVGKLFVFGVLLVATSVFFLANSSTTEADHCGCEPELDNYVDCIGQCKHESVKPIEQEPCTPSCSYPFCGFSDGCGGTCPITSLKDGCAYGGGCGGFDDCNRHCGSSLQSSCGECGNAPCCVDSSWSPDRSSVCKGEKFSQESNCGNTRTVTGTKDCSCGEWGQQPKTLGCCSGLTECSYCGGCFNTCPNSQCQAPDGVSCKGNVDCQSGICCQETSTCGSCPVKTECGGPNQNCCEPNNQCNEGFLCVTTTIGGAPVLGNPAKCLNRKKCVDNDGDGFGVNCAKGNDCDDSNKLLTKDCNQCGNNVCESSESCTNCNNDCSCPAAKSNQICVDSDSGFKIEVKGEATECYSDDSGGACIVVPDFCIAGKVLQEVYCDNNEIKVATYNCDSDSKCREGACRADAPPSLPGDTDTGRQNAGKCGVECGDTSCAANEVCTVEDLGQLGVPGIDTEIYSCLLDTGCGAVCEDFAQKYSYNVRPKPCSGYADCVSVTGNQFPKTCPQGYLCVGECIELPECEVPEISQCEISYDGERYTLESSWSEVEGAKEYLVLECPAGANYGSDECRTLVVAQNSIRNFDALSPFPEGEKIQVRVEKADSCKTPGAFSGSAECPLASCKLWGFKSIAGIWDCSSANPLHTGTGISGILAVQDIGIVRDFDITTTFEDALATGNYRGICGRIRDNGEAYCLRQTDDNWVEIKKLGSSTIDLSAGFSGVKGSSMRFKSEGDLFLGKVWEKGLPEPFGWTLFGKDREYSTGYVGFYSYGKNEFASLEHESKCGDGTANGECSSTKPYFCNNGRLMSDNRQCGCPLGDTAMPDGSCRGVVEKQCLCGDGSACAAGGLCLGGWRSIEGEWAIEKDTITLKDNNYAAIINLNHKFSDGIISGRIDLPDESFELLMLCGRMSIDAITGYCLNVELRTNQKLLGFTINEKKNYPVTDIAQFTYIAPIVTKKFNGGDEVYVIIMFEGDTMRAKVWGINEIEPDEWDIVVDDIELINGFAGVVGKGFNQNQKVTDFSVKTIQPTVILALDPENVVGGGYVTAVVLAKGFGGKDILLRSNTEGKYLDLYDDGGHGDGDAGDEVFAVSFDTSSYGSGVHEFSVLGRNSDDNYHVLDTAELIVSSAQCERILGSGNNVNFVVVPCLFKESESARFDYYADEIADTFREIEPFSTSLDLFSVYKVGRYDPELIFDDYTEDCRAHTAKIREIAMTCPVDQIIVVAKDSGEASGGYNMVVVPSGIPPCASDGRCPDWHGSADDVVKPVMLHELGHALGNFPHTCGGNPELLVPADPGFHNPACGEIQVSADQPCAEWNNPEYLKWGDMGCYPGCGDAGVKVVGGVTVRKGGAHSDRFKPWPTSVNVMCSDRYLVNGYSPIEKKVLSDKLATGGVG